MDVILMWLVIGVTSLIVGGMLIFLAFIMLDTIVSFRMSDWLEEGHWKKSPRTHIRERSERKRAERIRLEKERKESEQQAVERYYRERRQHRQLESRTWNAEFERLDPVPVLTNEELLRRKKLAYSKKGRVYDGRMDNDKILSWGGIYIS